MSITWVVRFCTSCFCAFDVEATGHRLPDLCDECRETRKREQRERCRPRKPRAVYTPEQRRELARARKAAWRERTGRH